ncbi:MAG: glycosyltransferase family 4 protein [Chitinispirillaceae bacterium]|nr:glycosyltransferase family 4 protein [Chitinispirillaceae bacterium]
MHILQINTEKGWRGGERQTLLSMQGLRKAGIRVTLLCLKERPLFCKAAEGGYEVIGVKNQFGALLHLLLRGKRYSVLHAQSSRAFGVAALATLLARVPLVYTRRTVFALHGFLSKLKFRRASALLAISKAAGQAIERAGLPQPEIISSMVIPSTGNQERIVRFKRDNSLDGKLIVGVVAALTREKNPFGMVDTARIVCRQMPQVCFVHFGDGALLNEMRDRIAQAQLQGNYLCAGFQEKVEELFEMFDVFAMASLAEGLGSSVLDAFAAGIPVASSDAGGLAELVQGRGLLSPKGDAELLAKNITTLLTTRKQAAALCSIAKRYVVENHGMKVLTERYIALYRSVMTRNL